MNIPAKKEIKKITKKYEINDKLIQDEVMVANAFYEYFRDSVQELAAVFGK